RFAQRLSVATLPASGAAEDEGEHGWLLLESGSRYHPTAGSSNPGAGASERRVEEPDDGRVGEIVDDAHGRERLIEAEDTGVLDAERLGENDAVRSPVRGDCDGSAGVGCTEPVDGGRDALAHLGVGLAARERHLRWALHPGAKGVRVL